MTVTNEMASKLAQQNDLALITIGRNSGEGSDREAKEGDFYLTPAEKELISIVSESFKKAGKKAVVVLNIGGVIETSSWKNIPDAILLAWQPGQEGGNSVVDVLSGKINPSGKLAITFPISYDDVPSAKSFPGHAIKGENDKAPDQSGFSFNRRVPWEAVYDEDVYVGYRYYNTFNVPVSYDFGYGKSYTSFSVANPKLSSTKFDKSVKVTVEVKNTGAVAGKEVVQVYLSSPSVKMKKPTSVLVAFGKTKNLKPGETQVLSFEVTPRDLCSFDETASAWVAEQGKYEVKIGTSSRQANAVASFNLGKELVVENVSNAMAPQKPVEKRF